MVNLLYVWYRVGLYEFTSVIWFFFLEKRKCRVQDWKLASHPTSFLGHLSLDCQAGRSPKQCGHYGTSGTKHPKEWVVGDSDLNPPGLAGCFESSCLREGETMRHSTKLQQNCLKFPTWDSLPPPAFSPEVHFISIGRTASRHCLPCLAKVPEELS